MDNYENNNPQEQPAQPYTQPYYSYPVYQQPVYQQQPPVQPPEKKGGKIWKGILAIAIVLGIVITSCSVTAIGINSYWQRKMDTQTQSFEEKLTKLRKEFEDKTYVGSGDSVSGSPNVGADGSLTPAQVYAKYADSVMAIECTLDRGSSSGSGFVLTTDGYIATNYHVVEGARKVTVTDAYGKTYTAAVIGGESSNDIAVLKVEADNLQAAVIGSSDRLIVGDQVVAIGNPLGTRASTLTVGYISAKDRMVDTDGSYINMIQTDAAINPGNSGGPLFNMKGEVVGITTAKYSGTTSSGATIEGIGFAIPMDDVIGMLEDIMKLGHVSGAYLGVTVSDVDSSAQLYGVPNGAVVQSVESGSCAEKGGIQAYDVIVEMAGQSVSSVSDLTRVLQRLEAGQTVTAKVFRYSAGGEVSLTLTLDQKPSAGNGSTLPGSGSVEDWFDHFFGN